jgi:hypothetical protein
VLAQLAGGGRALLDGGELRPADTGHHPGGAHGARSDADLHHVGAGLDEVAGALGGDHVPGNERHTAGHCPYGAHRLDRLLLVAVRGVDDEHVHAGGQQGGCLAGDVTVDPDGGRGEQPSLGVDGGLVQRRAQRALAGDHADQPVALDDRGRADPLPREELEDLRQVRARRHGQRLLRHDLGELGEPVDALALAIGDDTDRYTVVDDDHDPVRALRQQGQRLADGGRRAERDRGVVDGVPGLEPADHLADDVHRDVLRQHGEPPAARHGLGHPPSGDRRHVGDDDRDRRPHPVGGGQVHLEPGPDRRARRHHEDVGVGQVVGGPRAVQKAHDQHCP